MSAGYTVSREVWNHLEDIWLYTLQKWGIEQAESYTSNIADKFKWLSEKPGAGHLRNDVKVERYFLSVGMHLIVYKLVDGQPNIIRVLHQTADVPHQKIISEIG